MGGEINIDLSENPYFWQNFNNERFLVLNPVFIEKLKTFEETKHLCSFKKPDKNGCVGTYKHENLGEILVYQSRNMPTI